MRRGLRAGRTDHLSEEQRLLYRAALSPDASVAREAWRLWLALGGEARHPMAARLLPLVSLNLTRGGALPPEDLRRAYLRTLGANHDLLGATAVALRTLDAASIPTLVLKGAALVSLHYRDLGARPMGDADLLVPGERANEAVEVLRAGGWKGRDAAYWRRRGQHAAPLKDPSGRVLDLHWHVTYEATFEEADAPFWASAIACEVAGARSLALGPADQLLHSVVHGMRWSPAPSPSWIADAVTVLRGGAVDAQRLVEQARRLKLVWPLRRGLELVDSVVGPSPELDALLHALMTQRVSRADRVEQHYRVCEPDGVLGTLPNLWFAHRRSRGNGSQGLRDFAMFLSGAWELHGPSRLPAALLAKAGRRLRSALGTRPS